MNLFKTEHRRALSMLLAVLLILSMMAVTTLAPATVFADDSDTPPSDTPPSDTTPNDGGGSGTAKPTTPEPTPVVQETVTASSSTSGTTTSAQVSKSQMDRTVNSAISKAAKADAVPEVVVVVNTPARADSIEVTLPTDSLETLADVSGSMLTVSSGVATIQLNHTALVALVGSAQGSTIVLDVAPVEASAMTAAQAAVAQGATVVDISLTSGGVAIHDFNNGTITVTLPYTLKSGEKGSDIVVYYMADNGLLSRCSTSYTGGNVTFTTSHLSKYVIGTSALEPKVSFTDVPSSAWYYDYVVWAVAANVTQGMGDGTFAPLLSCSRAQFATFLYRAAGSPAVSGVENKFTDVSATTHASYYDAILWAVQQGVTTGTGDGTTFSPDETVSRAQAVTFMYRYAQKAGLATKTGGNAFTDAPNSGATAVYYDAILWAVANGITTGYPDGGFHPLDGCNRAEMVTFLYRLFNA